MCIYDRLNEIDLESVAKYVSGLQQPDGSFFGDKWGEVDTRFSFCAVAILTLIVSLEFQFKSSNFIEIQITAIKNHQIFSFVEQNGCDQYIKSC